MPIGASTSVFNVPKTVSGSGFRAVPLGVSALKLSDIDDIVREMKLTIPPDAKVNLLLHDLIYSPLWNEFCISHCQVFLVWSLLP